MTESTPLTLALLFCFFKNKSTFTRMHCHAALIYGEIKTVTHARVQTEAFKRSWGIIAILNSRCSEAGFKLVSSDRLNSDRASDMSYLIYCRSSNPSAFAAQIRQIHFIKRPFCRGNRSCNKQTEFAFGRRLVRGGPPPCSDHAAAANDLCVFKSVGPRLHRALAGSRLAAPRSN